MLSWLIGGSGQSGGWQSELVLQFHGCILLVKPIVLYQILRRVANLITSPPLDIKTFTPVLLQLLERSQWSLLQHVFDFLPRTDVDICQEGCACARETLTIMMIIFPNTGWYKICKLCNFCQTDR